MHLPCIPAVGDHISPGSERVLLRPCEDMVCRLPVLYIQTLSEGSSVLK